jgi:DNA-binding MarR family transcriptional regulator
MTDSLKISNSLRKWVETTTHRTMRDQARYVKSLGFSMPQFFLLMRVYYKKQCGISHLSEHMDITAAAASQLVEKLVQAGYLERTEDPSDRRAKLLKLSPEGAKLVEEGMNQRHRWMEEVVRNLSSDEQKKIIEALEILNHAAQDVDK